METDLDGLLKLMADGERAPEERRLNPTQRAFIHSPIRNKAYMGPAGCAKTTTGVVAIMSRVITMPGTKYMIGRNDYNDLKGTTMERFNDVLNRLPPGMVLHRDQSPPAKYVVQSIPQRIYAPDGSFKTDDRPSTVQFFGLKEVAKGSYDWNAAYVDEADECDEKAIDYLQSRLRTPGGGYSVMLTFNPPDVTHWLYTACTGLDFEGKKIKDPKFTLYTPDPRENVRNLPDRYYEDMAASMPSDLADRLVYNKWGLVFPGDPVYRQFALHLHVVDNAIEFPAGATLFRFWDFGYGHPACLFCAIDNAGRLYVYRERLGKQQHVEAFGNEIQFLTNQHFPHAGTIMDYGDPAVKQRKDTGQALAILHKKCKIVVRFKHTPFDLSLNEVRHRFERLIDGKPAIQIARRCTVLINGLKGGYHTKNDAHGNEPVKDGFYDHLCDALRYGVWNTLVGRQYGGEHEMPTSVAYSRDTDPMN